MRVRYQIAGRSQSQVLCDLSDRAARKLFAELKDDLLCEWAELVGEDDDNYMDVIDTFDNVAAAQMLRKTFGDMIKSKH